MIRDAEPVGGETMQGRLHRSKDGACRSTLAADPSIRDVDPKHLKHSLLSCIMPGYQGRRKPTELTTNGRAIGEPVFGANGFVCSVLSTLCFRGNPSKAGRATMEVPMTRHSASLAPAQGLEIAVRTARTVLRLSANLLDFFQDRREVRHLAELDDRALKDIGLLRGDVDGALAEPFYRKPTLVLVRSQAHRLRVQQLSIVDAKGMRPVVPIKPQARV